jgi:hypothetical protein
MDIKGTFLFVAILLATSAFAAKSQETTGTITGKPMTNEEATSAIRALLADPNFAVVPMLAENAYDFATGEAIPGFGPLDAAEAERRLARLGRE